jgi:hypothetical protein
VADDRGEDMTVDAAGHAGAIVAYNVSNVFQGDACC